MKTTPPLFAAALAFATSACSNDEHSSLRSAPSARHADAVAADDGANGPHDAAQSAASSPQKLPDDDAHSPNAAASAPTAPTPPAPADAAASGSGAALAEAPTVGIRNFRQIVDTMAALTGVPRTTPAIATALAATGGGLETQLPDSNDIRTFAGSHQVAISKLAVEFCDAMIENTTLAAAAVPGFDFTKAPAAAFDAAGKALVAKSLVDKFWGAGLDANPSEAETISTLTTLIGDLVAEPGVAAKAQNAQLTKNVVKGVCTAVLSTGPVLFL